MTTPDKLSPRHYLSPVLRKGGPKAVRASDLKPIRECAANELDRYAELVPALRAALHHIAFEPLTDDPEATTEECLAEAVEIARAALALANEDKP